MQFRGHSLPVRQSISVPLEFFSSSHFISQFPPTRFPLITAIRMCHFLPVHQSEWYFRPGRRSEYNIWIRPLICNSSSPVCISLTVITIMSIIISKTVTLMFHSIFSFLARQKMYLFSLCLTFTLWSNVGQNPQDSTFSLFLLYIIRGLAMIRWSVCITKSLRSLCLHSLGHILFFAYTI